MKRISALLIGVILTASATIAQDTKTTMAQTPSQRGLSLSVGPDGVIPLGSFRDNWKFGIGGSAKLAIPVMKNGDVTLSAGYIAFSENSPNDIDKNTLMFLPFKGGLRLRTNEGWYAEPQIGYTQAKITNEEGEGEFTYALGVGYLLNNMIDISTRYEAVATKGESSKMIGIRLAYNFNFARVK